MAKTVIENVVDIARAPTEVFDYASDHTHEPDWNPKMRLVRKLTEGPIGIGTRYEMEFVPGRPMVSTCVRFERPDVWELSGRTLGMRVTMGGRVTAIPSGSRLAFRTEFQSGGPLALALPLLRRRMSPQLQRDVETIKAILENPRQIS